MRSHVESNSFFKFRYFFKKQDSYFLFISFSHYFRILLLRMKIQNIRIKLSKISNNFNFNFSSIIIIKILCILRMIKLIKLIKVIIYFSNNS